MIWFSSETHYGSYCDTDTTTADWNPSAGFVQLSTKTVKPVMNNLSTPTEGTDENADWEFGYPFQAKVNGWIHKIGRYSQTNSTDNVTVHFWEEAGWQKCKSTATITGTDTGWQFAEPNNKDYNVIAEQKYRVSVVVSANSPLYTKVPGTFPREIMAGDDLINPVLIISTGVYHPDSPGYPDEEDTESSIRGVPDIEFICFAKSGLAYSKPYDTSSSSPSYISYVSSTTIPDNGETGAKIDWWFSVSSSTTGGWSSWSSSPGSLPRGRYMKWKALLTASSFRDSPRIHNMAVKFNRPPGTATFISPSASEGTATPTFQWTAAADPDGDGVTYALEVSTWSGFSPVLISSSGITGTVHVSTTTLTSGIYYCRVRATDKGNGTADRYGDWTSKSFTIDLSALSASSVPCGGGRVLREELLRGGFYEIKIVFNKSVDSTTINSSSFSLKNDNDENIAMQSPFAVWESSVTLRVSAAASPGIEPSTVYAIGISSAIRDKWDHLLAAPYRIEFTTLLSTASAVSFGGAGHGYTLDIPPGALTEPVYVERKKIDESDSALSSANYYARINSLLKLISGEAYSFRITDKNNEAVETFPVPVTLAISYAPADPDRDGYVYDLSFATNPVIKVSSLRIFRINENRKWELVPGEQSFDEDSQTITVSLSHFSAYGIIAYSRTADVIGGLKNVPNPFHPPGEETTIYYNLTTDCEVSINIYNLIGDLVRKFDADECPGEGVEGGNLNEKTWDGRNGLGRVVSDGVYICEIIAKYYGNEGMARVKKYIKIAVLK